MAIFNSYVKLPEGSQYSQDYPPEIKHRELENPASQVWFMAGIQEVTYLWEDQTPQKKTNSCWCSLNVS